MCIVSVHQLQADALNKIKAVSVNNTFTVNELMIVYDGFSEFVIFPYKCYFNSILPLKKKGGGGPSKFKFLNM